MIVLIRNPITYDSKIPCVDPNSKDSITSDKGYCNFYSPEGISRSLKRPERIHNYLSDFGRKPVSTGRNSEPTKQ
ncbi:hypothetical protein LEP1GSC161_3152 [Leptospira santarosai str. CBC1416]|uniref:Uncharacterized protein n=1 Tax=Leptospira santarosai str. CBC1416 TaxID=1193059 RepID=M6W4B1_9LEPT|nr:hypothetical protein LEP1GSC161_3152 [Leptospira santarosai str. CBC1416]